MRLSSPQNWISICVFLVVAVCTASPDAPIPVTTCGTVISSPGKYALANSLSCSTTIAIDIEASNVTFLLNGYTISGVGFTANFGINVGSVGSITNVSILGPGVITNEIQGVRLACSSCMVANVSATQNTDGFAIPASNGTLNNVLKGNTANNNSRYGFSLGGDNNTIKGNDSSNNATGFVLLDGNGNEIRGNSANSNSQDGIQVFQGTANIIRGNTAMGNNIFDLEDDDTNCDSNIWQGNDFVTASQSCIQ